MVDQMETALRNQRAEIAAPLQREVELVRASALRDREDAVARVREECRRDMDAAVARAKREAEMDPTFQQTRAQLSEQMESLRAECEKYRCVAVGLTLAMSRL